MEMRIEWSELASKQLRDIYDYYSLEANPKIALKIVNRIIDSVGILNSNPRSGPKEELLNEMTEDFMYLVVSNYEVIYWIENEIITIASVFDCRQNPKKMKKTGHHSGKRSSPRTGID